MIWRTQVKAPWLLLGITVFALYCLGVSASVGNWTEKHEAGRCAIRGQCGKKSFFGGELPCPDNGKARTPDKDTREKLIAICGNTWSESDVCCDDDQVKLIAGCASQSPGLTMA